MQIADGDAAERLHPCLESAVVGVDVLDTEDAVADLCSSGDVNWLMVDAGLASYDARAESGIGPQQGVGGELWDQVFAERLRGQVVEDRVIGDFLPVAHDKYWNLQVEPDA